MSDDKNKKENDTEKNEDSTETSPPPKNRRLFPAITRSFLQALKSVAAAAIGVQSRANQEVDFSKSRVSTFVIAGIIFTILFIIGVYFLVDIALNNLVPVQ